MYSELTLALKLLFDFDILMKLKSFQTLRWNFVDFDDFDWGLNGSLIYFRGIWLTLIFNLVSERGPQYDSKYTGHVFLP